MKLYEKYRPQSWDAVIGQDKAVRRLRRSSLDQIGGQAFWLSGKSGVGKTTLAYILAGEIADRWSTVEIDASELTPARLRRIEDTMQLYAFGKGGRAYIINEAHGLRRDTIRQLLVLLERLPSHVCVIFTTTTDGQLKMFEDHIDAHPLLSRCVTVALTSQGLSRPFAARCREIARIEGLDGQPIGKYQRLAQDCKANFRAMLQAVEYGEMMD